MSYIGGKPSKELASPTSQYFNGDGSTVAFTLDRPVNVAEDLDVFVSNVRQEPGSGKSYTATGTTLTFDAAPPSGTGNVYVVYRGLAEVTTRLEHDANAALAATTGTFSGDLTVDTNTLYVDSTNNRVGVGTTSPSTPLNISTANALGSTFTGTTAGEGLRVTQTNYTSGNFVSLVEAPYDDSEPSANVRIGAMFNGSGSNLSFGTSNSYNGGITNEAMRIDHNGNVGIGTTSPVYRGHFTDASSATRVQIENTNNAAGGAGIYFTTYSSGTLVSNATLTTDNSGNLKFFTGTSSGAEHMRLDANGTLLFATTSTTLGDNGVRIYKVGSGTGTFAEIANGGSGVALRCSRSGSDGQVQQYAKGTTVVGSVNVTASSTSYNTSSDYRLKENDVDMTGAVARVKQLQPKRFNFIADPDDTTVDGFMAHEVQTVVPEAITGTHNEVDDEGNPVYQGIDQAKLVPLLTGALQEAIAKIEALEARIEALEDA